MRIGSLFSGYEGLGMAVQQVMGGEIAWVSDIDPGACRILAHRFPDVPNLGDITAVDWSQVAPVDVLVGGFPCQDVSSAGLRKGLRPDTRSGLWAQFAHAINQLRPPLVVIENVRGLLSAEAHCDVEPCPWCVGDADGVLLRALGAVLGDLADIGYDASWQGVQACDVGAPHERFRVFVIAQPAADADRLGHERGRRARDGRPGPTDRTLPAPHPEGDRRHEGRAEPARLVGGPDDAVGGPPAAAHAHGHAVREQPVAFTGRGRAAITGHPGANVAADPDSHRVLGLQAGRDTLRADERLHTDRCGADPSADPDTRRREPDDSRLRAGQPDTRWGAYGPAIHRWERTLGRLAPPPTEPGGSGMARIREFAHRHNIDGYTARQMLRSGKWGARLAPAFVEWMQGLPAGWVTNVPGLTRNEQLKALGNGVVPQQAAQALRMLLPDVTAVAA